MTTDQNGLELTVSMPAAELAYLHRRLAFLEAALVQTLRDENALREWFSAAEFAVLRLGGLPVTKSGIARFAKERRWSSRIVRAQGGERLVYHFSSLPRRAFADFIDLVVRGKEAAPGPADAPVAAKAPSSRLAPRAKGLAAPPIKAAAPGAGSPTVAPLWVLPLLRLLKGGGPLDRALVALPSYLTPGVSCPTLKEARDVLRRAGIAHA